MGSFMLLVWLLLEMGHMSGGQNIHNDIPAGQVPDTDVTTVVKRMDTLERLLHEQHEKLVTQDNLLREQTRLIQVQAHEQAHQRQLLNEQSAKHERELSVLTEQVHELSDLRQLVRNQDAMLEDLKKTVHSQQLTLSRQETTMLHQDRLLRKLLEGVQPRGRSAEDDYVQKGPELYRLPSAASSDASGVLNVFPQNASGLGESNNSVGENSFNETNHLNNQEWSAQSSGKDKFIQYFTARSKRSDDNGPLEAVVSQRSDDNGPLEAVVSQRSDDNGPLEAVVSQLSQKVTEMTADIQTLKTNDNQQNQDIVDARTSVFVRWGNSHCGNGAQLVYSGTVGGSYYTHTGAAANYLCLTMSPVFGDPKHYSAYLYGGEYETSDAHQEKDPVCAVCRSAFSATVMVPGTNVCTQGWTKQYDGYLMAGGYAQQAASEYICVDTAFESSNHSDQNENGKLLYYTRTACGSLPCGPYADNKTVLCAVCSK